MEGIPDVQTGFNEWDMVGVHYNGDPLEIGNDTASDQSDTDISVQAESSQELLKDEDPTAQD